MIQIKRGSTQKWSGVTLAPGQPGYDKTKNKIKIGDGKKSWSELPYASGLHAEEILDSEESAQSRKNTDSEDLTLITYGDSETLKKGLKEGNIVGQIYLQQIDDPEVDYIVASGKEGIWRYQKWKSGTTRCWCNYNVSGTVMDHPEFFWRSAATDPVDYPKVFTFTEVPTETATVHSASGQEVLLVNSGANTTTTSGTYTIVSLIGEIAESTTYRISIQVEGFCEDKKDGDKN